MPQHSSINTSVHEARAGGEGWTAGRGEGGEKEGSDLQRGSRWGFKRVPNALRLDSLGELQRCFNYHLIKALSITLIGQGGSEAMFIAIAAMT